jgi:hypothetical protein
VVSSVSCLSKKVVQSACTFKWATVAAVGGSRVWQASAPRARLLEGPEKRWPSSVKAGRRGKEIETVTLGVAGDNSRSAARNFDDIRVGHESFLLLGAYH